MILPKFKSAPKSAKIPTKIAVLTSGGDSPGMNAAIRAVVRSALAADMQVYGVQRGYTGLVEGQIYPMSASSVANIIQRGGTILRTSRCEEFRKIRGRAMAAQNLTSKGIDGLVVIGGDGSYRGAIQFHREHHIPVIGLPGTIDNDISGSDDTIGFDTAVNTALGCIDKIRDTASSHDRLFVIEVMGRHAGHIALYTGIGGGAEVIVIPEVKTPIKKIVDQVQRGVRRGKTSSILVVAEGCHFGGAVPLAKLLKTKGLSPRVAILGHIQRGGSPTAHDRMLASLMGSVAVQALQSGVREGMVAVQHEEILIRSLKMVESPKDGVPANLMKIVEVLAT